MLYEILILDFHGCFTSHPDRAAVAINRAWKEILGRPVPKDVILWALARSKRQSLRDFLAQWLSARRVPEIVGQAVGERAKSLYEEIYIPTFGLFETIEKLLEARVKLVLLTNGELEPVTRVIKDWRLMSSVLGIFGQENTPGGRPKPSGEIVGFVLRETGLVPDSRLLPQIKSKVLVVGDYDHEIMSANLSGVDSAFLVTGRIQKLDRSMLDPLTMPTYLIYSLPELPDLVLANNRQALVSLHQDRMELAIEGIVPPAIKRISRWLEMEPPQKKCKDQIRSPAIQSVQCLSMDPDVGELHEDCTHEASWAWKTCTCIGCEPSCPAFRTLIA